LPQRLLAWNQQHPFLLGAGQLLARSDALRSPSSAKHMRFL
jgi:hypothetical protein